MHLTSVLYTLKISLAFSEIFDKSKYLINKNKKNIFMIRQDWGFCDQILQAAAVFDKKMKMFIFIFWNAFH